MYFHSRNNIRVFWYSEFGIVSPETPEQTVTTMEKLESSIADDLLSIWLRATGRTAQNILDDPKYKNIPQTARSTIQRMIDFWELEFNFSLTRNLWENGRLNMIKRVISDGFKWRDSIIIFDGNGGTNYDVKTVTEYNAIVFRDITKFNKNIFLSIFSTPENLRKYYGTINTKNWSDLWLYFQSRQWNSRLLEWVNPVLYKTFFTELADKRKKQEQDRINPLFADIRGKFSGSPQVIRGMELFAKGVGIEFWPDGNVDIDKILSQIIWKSEKEGKSYSEALKYLTTELWDLRKKIEDISKSIKAERQELLRSLWWTDISLSRFSELSHVSMLIRWSDGKEKDLRHTAIVSLTKNEANSLLNSISSSLDNKNISPRIAQVIILLGLQARYGEIGQAKWSIHATQKELEKNPHLLWKNSEWRRVVTIDQKTKTKIHLAGTISEQAQVLQDTGKLVQEMQDNIWSLESAQIALKKLRDNGIKTQKEREKEARLVAYIEQYTAVAKTYTIVERESIEMMIKQKSFFWNIMK